MTTPDHRRPLDGVDDRTLAGRAADGDLRAFESLLRRYGPLLRTYAYRVLGSNSEVDDVVQDAFIAAWQQLPSLEQLGSLRSWLIRIVTNKSIDRLRARRQHADIDDYEGDVADPRTPASVIESRSIDDALSVALSSLPDDQRRVWVLREIAGYSYEEMSEALQLPHSTVRGVLARARKNLISEMEGWR